MTHWISHVGLCLFGVVSLLGPALADEPRAFDNPGRFVGLELHARATPNSLDEAVRLVGRSDRLQLILTAKFDSSAVRDRTSTAFYQATPSGVVQVSDSGLVTPLADGEVTVTASADGQRASAKIVVERFADPPRINFANRIVPIFTKLGCNGGGCHGKSGGQNGFALSLLGFEPADDYAFLVKEGRGRRLFPGAPERSLLLQKSLGAVPHGGGARMRADSDEYRLLRLWIEQGMPFGQDDDPVLDRVTVFPEARTLPRGSQQQLKAIAHYSDGTSRDVTRQVQYDPNDKDIADAKENGLVQILQKPGDVAVMVRYQGQVAAFRATVPLGAPVDKLPPVRSFIDEKVFAKLKQLGLPPSEVCDDSTFVRRVTLDITGRLPTYEQTLAFLQNKTGDKRAKLIDHLLESDGYAELFAQKWSAILRNKVERNQPRGGNFRFHDWLRTSIAKNKPYDQLVREIVTASGDVAYNPAVNWHRHVKDMNEKIEDTAQVFLGLRIQCARCHHHPFEKWSQDDYWSMAAFYSNVRVKNNRYIYAQRGVAQARNPRTGKTLKPKGLDSERVELTADQDARQALADWLTSPKNPFFAKALANRYWKHFLGRGIVAPEDDMRATNPPSNPELLDALAKHVIESRFDLKQLVRTICNSSVYQLSAMPNEFNAGDQQAFSRFQPRRLQAEIMLDSLDQLLDSRTGFSGLPSGTRALQIPDHGGVNNAFLNAFGRPAGASACECESTINISMTQSLQLLNSDELYSKLEQSRARKISADPDRSDQEKITELYYRALCRPPTETETQIYRAHLATYQEGQKYQGYEDILWTLINTKEFMFNH